MSAQPEVPARRRSSRGQATTSANAEDVYAIEAIICCSLYPLVGPTGEEEYFYLVRWQGYGPEHDTWEPRSNLTNSSEAVKEYDVRNTPFTILDVRNTVKTRKYLVQFGLPAALIPPSPQYPKLWMTADELKEYCFASVVDKEVKLAVRRASEVAKEKKRKMNAEKRRKQAEERERKSEEMLERKRKREEMLERKREEMRKRRREERLKPRNLTIIASRKKTNGKGAGNMDQYLADWHENGMLKSQWRTRWQLYQIFGADCEDAISDFRARAKASKPEAVSAQADNTYEQERLRIIEENKLLLRNLGLPSS